MFPRLPGLSPRHWLYGCLVLLVRRPPEWFPEGRLSSFLELGRRREEVFLPLMPDFRVYVTPPPIAGAGELVLSPAEVHHLVNVNRAKVGDPVIAFDGNGLEWACTLLRLEARKAAVLRVVAVTRRAPPPCRLILGQGLPKGGTMDEIVRQATELGVHAIVPLSSVRSEVRLDLERAEKKVEKWCGTAVEAAKQCGNPFLPRILPPQSVDHYLTLPEGGAAELRLVASLLPTARPLREVFAAFRGGHEGRAPLSVAWLIGPEGDLTPEETAAAMRVGWWPVSLGSLVLRCDTAAVYALAATRCETEAEAIGSLGS